MAFEHQPVMLQECIHALGLQPAGIYMDGTAGGGGHAKAIAGSLKGGHLYAFDQDPDAVTAATEVLQGLPASVVHANFRSAREELAARGVEELSGVLLDLGVSSHQLDTLARGFSYKGDAPLDMRMSQTGPTAADILNHATRQEIADILRRYGEEPYAWQIAGKVVRAREDKSITTTGEFLQIITSALPPAVRRKDKNPGRRSFQALRIAVNAELDVLEEGLEAAFSLLKPGGRLVVLTFHSLEDRLVKHRFREWCTACTCPPDFPICVCGGRAKAKLVGKNPLTATPQEQEDNRRSRSAKMRALEKI